MGCESVKWKAKSAKEPTIRPSLKIITAELLCVVLIRKRDQIEGLFIIARSFFRCFDLDSCETKSIKIDLKLSASSRYSAAIKALLQSGALVHSIWFKLIPFAAADRGSKASLISTHAAHSLLEVALAKAFKARDVRPVEALPEISERVFRGNCLSNSLLIPLGADLVDAELASPKKSMAD